MFVRFVPEAFRTWKLIEDGGPGEAWVACSTGRSVDSATAQECETLVCNSRDFVQHQYPSQEQEQVLSSFKRTPKGSKDTALIRNVPSYAIPESHEP
jgi:hypothetical protein